MRKRSPQQIDEYKRKWKLGEYNNSYNQSHSRWCIDNGYRIYREPYGNCSPVCTQFKIAVEKEGSLMAIALLSAHNLRLLLKKMGLRKSEPKYIKRKT
jgi:hypothetical protein